MKLTLKERCWQMFMKMFIKMRWRFSIFSIMKFAHQYAVLLFLAAGLFVPPAAIAADYYAAQNGQTPAGSYTSWATAASNIQNAVNAAPTNGVVWVGAGHYTVPTNAVVYKGTNVVHIYKPLTLRSSNGVSASTVIDGGGYYRGIAVDYAYSSTNRFLIDGFTVSNCSATNAGGGIIFNSGSYTAVVQNCLISDNKVVSPTVRTEGGGGIYTYSTLYYVISNCTFRGNRVFQNLVTGGGGGTYLINSSWGMAGNVGRIDNCLFESNSVFDGAGGGLLFFNSGVHELRNCVIRGNIVSNSVGSVSLGGGGIGHTYGATVQMWNCLVYNNFTTCYGGGIYNMKGGTAGLPLIMYNCTVVSNRATGPGESSGGVESRDMVDYIYMYNSIVCSNIGVGSSLDIRTKSNGRSFFTNCCITSTNFGWGQHITDFGGGIFTNSPAFVDFASQNFRLAPDSPCINTGTNQDWMINAVDLDGKSRIDVYNGIVDMGAYEYWRYYLEVRGSGMTNIKGTGMSNVKGKILP